MRNTSIPSYFYKYKCYLTLRIIEKIYKIIRCSDKELKKICVYSPFFVFLQGKGGTHGRRPYGKYELKIKMV